MPVYEFQCRLCGHRIEQGSREYPECPDCTFVTMKRVFGFSVNWPMQQRGH